MTEKTFEEYVRSICMPTQWIDTTNYKIVEIVDCECGEMRE